MALLKRGSKGEEVIQLQNALNSYGNYGLDVDGIYGDQTYKAVRDYQAQNGLDVDGIVGDQTWGALQAMTTATDAANPDAAAIQTATTARGNTYNPAEMTGAQADTSALEGAKPTYAQSQALTDALNELQAYRSQKPGEYTSPYAAQIEALYQQATGEREPFQYDPNVDPIYQMYRDRYTQAARQSMEDTMANAAALTGGYGNSYAQAAAQQAYDQQMQGVNDILPDLYNAAYGRYQDEGEELLQKLALAQQMDATEYGRWQDQVADYYNQLNALLTLADDQYNREYGQYQDQLGQYNTDLGYYYGKTQDELAQQNLLNQMMLSSSGSSSGGSSGGRSSSGSGKSSSGSGTSTATGKNYKTVLATAKGMTDAQAYDYVQRMAEQGYISNDEGYRILAVEMGIDTDKYATAVNIPVASGRLAGQTRSSALASGSTGSTGTSSANRSRLATTGNTGTTGTTASTANALAALAAAAAANAGTVTKKKTK